MFDIFSLIAGIIIGGIAVNEYYVIKRMLRAGKRFFYMFTSAIGSLFLAIIIIFVLYKLFEYFHKKK